jgi:hypothetical protein
VAAQLEVFALVFAVAEPEAFSPVAELGVFSLVAQSGVFSPAAEPGAFSPAAEPGVFFVVVASIADVAEPQASGDIAVVFVVLVPAAVFGVEVDKLGRPKFPAFPNVDYFASSSSFVEAVGKESVHSPTDARTNYDLCSILSTLGLH